MRFRQQTPKQAAQIQIGHLVEIVKHQQSGHASTQQHIPDLLHRHPRLAGEGMQHPPTLRLGQMPHLQGRARLADSAHPFEQHATAAGQGLQPRKDRLGLGVGALLRCDERQHLRPQVATKPGEVGAVFAVAQHQGHAGPQPAIGDPRQRVQPMPQVAPIEDTDGFDRRSLVGRQSLKTGADGTL